MDIQWQDHIESSPEVLKGKPRVKRTRIPVSLILGYLEQHPDRSHYVGTLFLVEAHRIRVRGGT
jgi:uncharacterized protein (DUF433 family)